jgi:hypothetical protein
MHALICTGGKIVCAIPVIRLAGVEIRLAGVEGTVYTRTLVTDMTGNCFECDSVAFSVDIPDRVPFVASLDKINTK